MATGGFVPSGFPNDSFPAMLTSGEEVIPAGDIRNSLNQKRAAKRELIAKVEGRDLLFLLRETEQVENTF